MKAGSKICTSFPLDDRSCQAPQTESDRLQTAEAGPFDLASTSFRVKCEGKMRRAEAMSSLETHGGPGHRVSTASRRMEDDNGGSTS